MILDDIRDLKIEINDLKSKIDNFSMLGAIRYDKENVQTSPSGDSLDKAVIRHIEDQEQLNTLKDIYDMLLDKVNLSEYTVRQREFIHYYYFNAFTMKMCCSAMCANYNNLCNIKKRIELIQHNV